MSHSVLLSGGQVVFLSRSNQRSWSYVFSMSRTSAGFWVNNILDRLSWELTGVLRDNLASRPYCRERLDMQILLTLSKKVFVDRLLFRDLTATSEHSVHRIPIGAAQGEAEVELIHDQAIEYLYGVLGRRLTLAQNLVDRPTNMHVLFALLCRYGPANEGWQHAEIKRDKRSDSGSLAIANGLRPFAEHIQRQRLELDERYSEISARRRAEYGPYWLVVGESALEMPEEMSLFDVVDALPKPLDPAFMHARDIQNQLNRVLKSLNERYMLLRSCGLDPATWLQRAWPPIGGLRELRQLLREAEGALRAGHEQDNAAAYERAFNQLKANKRKFAGCATFSELAASETGAALLRRPPLALDQAEESELDGVAGGLDDPIDRNGDNLAPLQHVEILMQARPDLFDPLMAYFFRQAVGLGRSLAEVLIDSEFRRLIAADTAYAAASNEALAELLRGRAERIIELGVQQCGRAAEA